VILTRLENRLSGEPHYRLKMMRRNRRAFMPLIFVFLCIAPRTIRAQGGPPLLTDDPDTPGKGRWEINVAYAAQKSQAERAADLPRIDINYGLGPDVQIKYETAWSSLDRDASTGLSGISNSLAGAKWRFLDSEQAGFSMSTYPQIEFNNPTDSLNRGLVEKGPNLLIPFEASRTNGTTVLVGEVGRWLMRDAADQWVAGVAVGALRSDGFELLAELHATADSAFRHADPVLNVGARKSLSEKFSLLTSAGMGLRNSEDRTRWTVYLGLQIHVH
jgi:hypothetical protein